MTNIDLNQLFTRSEAETLDFKSEAYNLKEKRHEFIKDLLAMANTPREGDAYIVLGVRWTPEKGCTVVGLDRHEDDADFQNALKNIVQPRFRFTYTPCEHNGNKIGLLTIPVGDDGPYAVVNGDKELTPGIFFYRRGSTNDRATGTELMRIVNWFAGRNGPSATGFDSNVWRIFSDSINCFSSDHCFILAADPIPVDSSGPLYALGMVPWRAIIDFDSRSERSGLLHLIGGFLSQHRVIHRVVKGEYDVQPEPGTHWFFTRGLDGRAETLAETDHKSWIRLYKQELGKQLEQLTKHISPRPIVVVVIWSHDELRNHLRTLLEEFEGAFGELAEVVVISSCNGHIDDICLDAGVKCLSMSLRSLCSGIAVEFADQSAAGAESFVLPMSTGAPIEIKTEDRLWFEEGLELLYKTLGLQGDDSAEDFRRGGEVSWRNLHLRHDCDRDVTARLRTQVELDLRHRQTVRINLYHAPGAGGTTVGRRVLWELRELFPVGILKRSDPRNTAERIAKVCALTESSFLLLADGEAHSERDIDDLYDFLKSGQIPVVVLQVLRRFRVQQNKTQLSGKRQYWVDAELSDIEADRFCQAYRQAIPSKDASLRELARKRDKQRTAFFFGLTAFGRDFRGLREHVKTRITNLTMEQRRILIYISLAHYYGQQTIPAQAFASYLTLSCSHIVDLSRTFQDSAAAAMELLLEASRHEWRTTHPIIALEILEQMLAPQGSLEPDRVWRQNLSNWAKEFASFCRGDHQTNGESLLELVRRVFIYRDNMELLGTERAAYSDFSHIIEDIPSSHGRIDLLRHLTTEFPLEAHFHAHLGRFLGLTEECEEGLQAIDRAIALQPTDHVLHHMRGMVLRSAIKKQQETDKSLDQIIELAKNATQSFEEARRLSPDLEHAYISEVQMLIAVLDFAGKIQRGSLSEIIMRTDTDPFIKYALDRAEDLLDQVQRLYGGEQPSRYAVDCRARLQRIYGDFSTSLQAWDHLLARPDVAKPPVRRQIVWTILRRHQESWDELNRKEIERVQRLLEENLEEDVKDSTSLRLWLRAIRQSQNPPSLDAILEKVVYWKINTGSLDAAYYLYVLHSMRGLEGSRQGLADAEKALEECRALARFRRDRTRSFEWIGNDQNIKRLVHQSRLGEWRDDFWESTAALSRLSGRVISIDAPQKGLIEIEGGLEAFFVPAKSDLHRGRDENAIITCYLGFSYDGPRAWDIRLYD